MAPATPAARAASVFAALGDETRLKIVARLCDQGPLSISRLSVGAAVSRQAITKHLKALAGAGLARSTRAGRESIWELRTNRISDARRSLEQISAQWDAALSRLRSFVETGKESTRTTKSVSSFRAGLPSARNNR